MLNKFFEKTSWITVFVIVFLVNFNALFITRLITDQDLSFIYLFWYFSTSMLVAFVTILGMYKIYYFTFIVMIFNFFAIVNMIYISVAQIQGEWTGITGFINYITFIFLGMGAGIAVQLVYNLKERNEIIQRKKASGE